MGVVVIGPSSETLPRPRRNVVVQVKKAWSDSWTTEPDLEAVSAGVQVGALGPTSAVLRWRYGEAKGAYVSAFATVAAKSCPRWWVRLRMTGDTGMVTLWQGQIVKQTRVVFGSSDDTPRGHQYFTAYDGNRILDRIGVWESYWLESGSRTNALGWLPSINIRGKSGVEEGNRSATEDGGSYLYGGPGLVGGTHNWTARQYIEYLLNCFVNASGRPVFTLGGQTDILDDYTPRMRLRASETVGSIIRKLVAPEFGMGYVTVPTDDGWEIRAFSYLPEDKVFADATLPQNSFDAVRIDAADDKNIVAGGLTVEIDVANLYDSVRVIGERAVVVCSAYGPGYYGGQLDQVWSAGDEADYNAATDAARASDRYRLVYKAFKLADSWKFQGGYSSPRISLTGKFLDGLAAWQTSVRETLSKLPLYEDWDYSAGVAPTAAEAAGKDFRPPLVVAKLDDGGTPVYVPVDRMGGIAEGLGLALGPMSVSVLEGEWGVILSGKYNHFLAKNHWSGAAASEFDAETDGVDWEDLIVTLAIRADERLALGCDLPTASKAGDGSVKVVERPGAEFWYMACGTVLDANDGSLRTYDGPGVVLRNDKDRLALAAAGAIARYLQQRAKLSVTYGTLKPLGELVGAMVTTVDSGDVDWIGSPITAVEWHFEANDGTGTTALRAGNARR